MVETLLFFVLIGCLLGIMTGLTPGIHVNTIAVIALGLFQTGRFELVVLIVSMSIVHTFMDFIPSVMLGVPGEDNLLSVLPGHRFFLKGKGHHAVLLTVWGGIVGGIAAIALSPIFLKFLQKSIAEIAKAIPFILAAVLALMVLKERETGKKIFSLAIIALSSLLGIIALSAASSIKNPLIVLVLGFFGAAPLLHSLKNKPVAKKQGSGEEKIESGVVFESALLSVLAASFVSMLPGIGPNQAALTVRTIVGKIRESSYLVLLGGINTANMFFSLIVLYAIGKTRTGTAVAIKQLIELQPEHMFALVAVSLIAIAWGAIATVAISKWLLKVVGKFDYGKINLFVFAVLVAIVFSLSNSLGMIAFATATMIGFAAIAFGIKRSHCMAFLMVPTILYYGFSLTLP